MKRNDHISVLNELSASEGVFTAAQAKRLGVPRSALSKAVAAGRAERILHGAYRLAGIPQQFTDELAAVWKLTAPASFSHERMGQDRWDGVAVGGSTAASLLGIGDFHLSPYRVYAPRRINSRLDQASFAVRSIGYDEVAWISGLPVTCIERTLVDLCLDCEDPSLIEDALDDACRKGIDPGKLRRMIAEQSGKRGAKGCLRILEDALENKEGRDEIQDS